MGKTKTHMKQTSQTLEAKIRCVMLNSSEWVNIIMAFCVWRVTFASNDKYPNVSSLFTRFVCERVLQVIYTIEKCLQIA